MYNLEKKYDEDYVNMTVAKKWRYEYTPRIVKIMYDFFKPSTVLDIGAANGLHTLAFRTHGCSTFGIEGTQHYTRYLDINSDEHLIQDIRKPFDLHRKFDLVHCVEVLEHIEETYVNTTVTNICKHGDTLFITANPTLGGIGHVNAKPKIYWIRTFANHGFEYCEEETNEISKQFIRVPAAGWYAEYSGIYRRK